MLVVSPVLNVGGEQWGRSRRGSPLPASKIIGTQFPPTACWRQMSLLLVLQGWRPPMGP